MSEHDKLAEAREALAEMVPAACDGNALSARWWAEQWGLIVLAALDGHAAALAAARAEGAQEAYERAEKAVPTNWCDPMLTGAQAVIGKNAFAPDVEALLRAVAAAIRALAEKERGA